MRRSILVALTALVVAIAAAPAVGQKTTPASDWDAVVHEFIHALQRGEVREGQRLLTDRHFIASLRNEPASSLAPLIDAMEVGTVVFSRAYDRAPLALAEDISVAVQASDVVPPEVRQWLIPADEHAMRHANATAGQWLAQTLNLKHGQPVAVVMLWRPARSVFNASAKSGEVFFLLMRGESGESSRLIEHVVFGVPVAFSQR
jgi:hypothetical protein